MEPSCYITPFGREIAIAKFISLLCAIVHEGFIYKIS